jgi:hypothetical protein
MNFKLPILFIFLSSSQCLSAQNYLQENIQGGTAFANDINGMPLYLKMENKTEGSIYFYDNYTLADITMPKGTVYKNVLVKYNLLDNQLQYQLEDGKEMIAVSPVTRVVFHPLVPTSDSLNQVILTGGAGILNKTGATVYQLIDSGKISLLRKITLTWRDDTQYGQAGSVRKYERNDNEYWLANGDIYTKLERSRSFFVKVFGDKGELVGTYIDKIQPKYKSAEDLRKIVRYYNTL